MNLLHPVAAGRRFYNISTTDFFDQFREHFGGSGQPLIIDVGVDVSGRRTGQGWSLAAGAKEAPEA